MLQYWNDIHIAVEINRESDQESTALYILGCSALLRGNLDEVDSTVTNLQKLYFGTTFTSIFFLLYGRGADT